MPQEHIVAVLDIGTTKIVCLVGEVDDEGNVYVIGHGQRPPKVSAAAWLSIWIRRFVRCRRRSTTRSSCRARKSTA